MTTIGIFLIMAILIYFRRGHKHLKEIAKSWFSYGFWSTVIWFGLYFLVHVLYFSPSAIYWEQNQAINDESNQVVSLTTQLRLAQNPNDQKIIQWHPPRMNPEMENFYFAFGGQFTSNGGSGSVLTCGINCEQSD